MINAKILLVEDSEVDRAMLSSVLTKKGYAVIALQDGRDCLKLIEEEMPALVLLDILMPGVRGDDLLVSIREKYSAIQLPVIMITSKSDVIDVVELLQKGANDYIVKPIHFEVTLMRILTHLRIAELSAQMGRLKEMSAVNAMITTYNHEINNPLAIAVGLTHQMMLAPGAPEDLKDLESVLWRISDIVKKISEILPEDSLNFANYGGSAQMVKLK